MRTNAIVVPSGDHAGSSWSASSRVSWTILEPSTSMVNNCSLPESIEMKTSFLPFGEGNGSKFWAWVICTGMEIALSAAAAACSHMSDVARRSEKKLKREKELRREVMTALLAMNLSQSKEVKRTKPVKKLPRVTRCSSSVRVAATNT